MAIIAAKRQYKTVGPVGVVRINTGEVDAKLKMANAVQEMTNMAITEMGRQSVRQGEEMAEEVIANRITTINPKTGKPEALDWVGDNRFLGRKGAEAYTRVVTERFQHLIENDIKLEASRIATEVENKPHSVEEFKDKMLAYGKGMLKGTEDNGKPTVYSRFAENTLTHYITASTINLDKQRQQREREQNKIALSELNSNRRDLLYQNVYGGPDDLSTAQNTITPLMGAIIDSVEDGVESGNLDFGEVEREKKRIAFTYGSAVIAKYMDGLSVASSSNIAFALKNGDVSDLNKEEQKIFNEIVRYSYGVAIDEEGNQRKALDRNISLELSKIAEQKTLEIANDFERNKFAVAYENYTATNDLLNDVGISIDDLYERNDVDIDKLEDLFINRFDDIIQAGLNLDIENLDRVAFETELAQKAAEKLIIEAYQNYKGLPEDARKDINRGYISAEGAEELRGKTKAAIKTLNKLATKYSIPRNELDALMQDLSSSDKRNSTIRKNEETAKTLLQIEDALSEIQTSDNFERVYVEGLGAVDSGVYLSAVQKANAESQLKTQYGLRLVNNETTTVTRDGLEEYVDSSDLNDILDYLVNNNDEGIEPSLKQIIDDNLSKGFASKSAMIANFNNRKSVKSSIESNDKAANDATLLISQIESDDTNRIYPTEKEKKILSSYILGGQDANDFYLSRDAYNAENPAAQRLFNVVSKGYVPDELIDYFDDLIKGVPFQSNDANKNLLTLYSQFSKQVSGNAIVNLIRPALGDDKSAKLEAILELSKSSNLPVGEIATSLKEAMLTDRSKTRSIKLGSVKKPISDDNFIMETIEDTALNTDARRALVPLVQYLDGAGFSKGEIQDKIKKYYNSLYADTEGYIVDQSSINGQKSSFALDRLFLDSEIKSFFVDYVNNEISNAGYNLSIRNDNITENRAYLFPIDSRGGGVTFMVMQQDEQGVFVPVMANGLPLGVSTSEDPIKDFAQKRQKNKILRQRNFEEILEIRKSNLPSQQIDTDQTKMLNQIQGGYLGIPVFNVLGN